MQAPFQLAINPTGLAFAVLAVILGAPWFAQGLRALRMRRHFAELAERPLDDSSSGFVQTRGRVSLESPLFAPLSALRCAGFQLDVRAGRGRIGGSIRVRRPFQLVTEGATARVLGDDGDWDLPVTAERTVAAREPLSENVAALVDSNAELRWLRGLGVPLQLTERALEAGVQACVVGVARHVRPREVAAEMTFARTGTDDFAVMTSAPAPAAPDLWIESGEPLDALLVTTGAPRAERLRAGFWRWLGLAGGPALTILGLLYLVEAAERTFGGWL